MLSSIFHEERPIIGMIHVGALPGTPASALGIDALVEAALREAAIYREAGIDGLLVENMHDTPYLRGAVGPEIVAAMTRIAAAVKAAAGLPTGVQVLAAANREALAVATCAGLDWIRVEGFCFAHVADEGIIEGCAGELLRYRRAIGGERVQIWADIKKKHASHAITADLDVGATAAAAAFMRADAVIITGTVTGDPPRIDDVRAARTAGLPVLLGSGVVASNLSRYFEIADAFVIGSAFKEGGRWDGPVERRRVDELVAAAARLRRRL
ncbi:MAG: BtpA/SgcQ family protein [Myxococcales bacterium]|nr:BtpA/SgcQ family protein [Myxococcales bacterium]